MLIKNAHNILKLDYPKGGSPGYNRLEWLGPAIQSQNQYLVSGKLKNHVLSMSSKPDLIVILEYTKLIIYSMCTAFHTGKGDIFIKEAVGVHGRISKILSNLTS